MNSLPNDKILEWSKFKEFADDKIDFIEKLKVGWVRVENIVGKGENAGYQHFLLFHSVFKSPLFQGRLKSGLHGKELIYITAFQCSYTLKNNHFKNTVEKGEDAGNTASSPSHIVPTTV